MSDRAQATARCASGPATPTVRRSPARSARNAQDGSGGIGGQGQLQAHLVARGQRRRRARGGDPAVAQDHDAVDRALGLGDVVGDQDDRAAVGGQRAHLLPEQPPAHRVDVVGRLVEHDQAAGLDDRHAERGEAPHAAGEPLAGPVGPLLDVQRGQQLGRAPSHRPVAAAPDPAERSRSPAGW
nr:hypothetical protein GCM10020092_067150 [Actinoplanes digitatis]